MDEHGVLRMISTEYLEWISTEYLGWMMTEYLEDGGWRTRYIRWG